MASRRLILASSARRADIVRAAALLGVAAPALLAGTAAAGQAVVQPLPPPAAADLSNALRQLARSPRDFDALIAAGRASLTLGDIDAAVGFFGRADAVRAGDARVKAGLATAYLKSDRPIEALQMFEQALAAGAPPAIIAPDRGLAFDLVGDNVSAQTQYKLALAQGPNPEVVRRLGLSQAISGDRKGFEATLLPHIQRRDFAAYRVRAFGLAILGDEQEAVSIAEAVMPRDLAGRITPYLRYMPRLTRAQQAAAANLGSFPRAAQIGRDDPRFAQYAGPQPARPAQGADARLAPAGEPLGPKTSPGSARNRRQVAAAERQQQREAKQREPAARPTRPSARDIASGAPVTVARVDPPRAAPSPARPAPVQVVAVPPPAASPPPSSPPAVQGPVQVVAAMPAPAQAATSTPVQKAVAVPPPPPNTAPSITLPAQPVVVAQLDSPLEPVMAQQAPTTLIAASAPVLSAAPPEPQSLADAFAEFAQSGGAVVPASGAVDITAIKPKREVVQPPKPAAAKVPPPPPPPAKPKAPSRVWVQVATGKDLAALGFDWRRYAKKAPELLGKRSAYTAKWGESRRLLTGPFDSPKAAAKMVADLKAKGIDSFTFTSEVGEDVSALK